MLYCEGGMQGAMEGERDPALTPPEEMPSASPKAKRIASPRWSKHETLVMIEAKRKHELELQKANGLKGGVRGAATQLTDFNKWDLVSASCRAVGIDRDGKMCRKRWFNLLTEFKKIRDWCKTNRVEEFWTMSGDERREKKLPTGFDQEVFQAMEAFDNNPNEPSLLLEAGSRGAATTDDGLFSEIDQDVVQPVEDFSQHLENNGVVAPPPPPQQTPRPAADQNGIRLPPVAPKTLHLPGMIPARPKNLKKRKHPSSTPVHDEGTEPKDPYMAMLESTSRTLQAAFTESMQAQIKMYSRTVHAQIEAQKQENELERALRKEQGDKLIGVLTTLVDTLSKIAEKL